MKYAYALLGVSFLVVLTGAFLTFEKAHAPVVSDTTGTSTLLPIVTENTAMSLTLTSPAFVPGGMIPPEHTCDGANINPPLEITGVPAETKSLALIMYDPDIPSDVKERLDVERYDHWVLYNIPPETTHIPEAEGDALGKRGLNSRNEEGYIGSCPPDGEHRYFFRLFALPNMLDFPEAPTLAEVERAATAAQIESTELIGRYDRQ